MTKSKKIFLVFVGFIILFLGLSFFCFAQQKLEITYPEVPGVERPITIKTTLPSYVRYIFNFSIMIAGLVAFGALIMGGFRYLTSVGSPAAMEDAKDQVFSGFLGLIILLASWLILHTLNPQLVFLHPPEITERGWVKLINASSTEKILVSDESDLTNYFKDNLPNKIEFLSDYVEKAELFTDIKSGGTSHTVNYSPAPVPLDFFPKSIELSLKIPGVKLFSETNYKDDSKLYRATSDYLEGFNDKASSIKFVTSTTESYGAILHEHANRDGDCGLYLEDNSNLGTYPWWPSGNIENYEFGNNKASSITVFKKTANNVHCKITYCDDVDCCPSDDCASPKTGCNCLPKEQIITAPEGVSYVDDPYNDNIRSIYIYNYPDSNGKCLAVLFDDKNYGGKCEVFSRSDSDLTNNPIGRCAGLGFWNTKPCASSLIIIPTK